MQMIQLPISSSSPLLHPSHFLLDIETTGLSKTKEAVIAIGVLFNTEDHQLKSIQWFAESRAEEEKLLQSLINFSAAYRAVYTYNGNSFDIPFILSRLKFCACDDTAFKRLAFRDMKKSLSKLASSRTILEKSLDFKRQTTLKGKELALLYKAYEAKNSSAYQTLMLNHQTDELRSLLALYEIDNILQNLSTFQLISFTDDQSLLKIVLKLPFPLTKSFYFELSELCLKGVKNTGQIELWFPLYQGPFKKYLTPFKDYYLIEGENQLMHKSVARFIPKAFRHKVTAKECFVLQEGLFIKMKPKTKSAFQLFFNEQDEPFVIYEANVDWIKSFVSENPFKLC